MPITDHTSQAPIAPTHAKPERLSAIAVAVVVAGFDAWVLTTLPIQAAVILTVAGALAYACWIFTTYAHP